MDQAAHFIFVIGLLSTLTIAILIVRALLPQFFVWFHRTTLAVPKVLLATVSICLLAVFVVSKDFLPGSFYSVVNQSPYANLYSPASAAALANTTNTLTPAQYRAQFALTTVTNLTHDFTAPTNAVFCDIGPGVHDEAYWIPVAFNPEGTITNSRWGSAVCVAPSGLVLLDTLPDRLAPTLPDLTGAITNRILSILQTPAGLKPPEGVLWYSVTTNQSFLVTWQNLLLGRQTNALADLQLELYQNGDFTYRLHLNENADATTITNWLIAAQDNGGGEVFAFAQNIPLPQLSSDPFSLVTSTNLIPSGLSLSPQTLELQWTFFGELNPTNSDNDTDGLTDWDELYLHHTAPSNPDTDADGLTDEEEVSSGFGPLDSDADNDGIPDGTDPQPIIFDDPESDADGDGIPLAEELANGLDPATDDSIDSDGDGWADWKERLAGSNPRDCYSMPSNYDDGSAKIFDVTFSLNSPTNANLVVKVGTHTMILSATTPSITLTLTEGIAHDVTLFTASSCTASLSATIHTTYAVFRHPHAVFSGSASLPGKWAVAAGQIVQPVPGIDPEIICFHSTADKSVSAYSIPDVPGTYHWRTDEGQKEFTGKDITLSYADQDTWISVDFTPEGTTSARLRYWGVNYCTLLDEHPDWLDPENDEPPYRVIEEPEGESTSDGSHFTGTGHRTDFLVPVNNDDDDASESADTADKSMSVSDDDLVGYYPLGYFNGQCCPCPEHHVKYTDFATLVSASSGLSLYTDTGKTNAFNGEIHAAEALYVEGRSKSPAVGTEKLVWQYTDTDNETHEITNVFTVLSQRIFGDFDFDGEVDTADKALHPGLSPEFGWTMPVDTNAYRLVQLKTDVNLSGIHTLTLSGQNAFRVWQSPNPSTTNAPLLVSGQTVTNGVNGISWGTSDAASLYLQTLTNGTATLTYSFIGTGSASGIVCRATMKMTAWNFALVPDFDRDGKIDKVDSERILTKNVYRFWINDDRDLGFWATESKEDAPTGAYEGEDSDEDLEGRVRNCLDASVNGVRDLVDFFSLRVDLPSVSTNSGVSFRLRQSDGAINFAYTPLSPETVGDLQTNSCTTGFGVARNTAAEAVPTVQVTADGVDLDASWFDGRAQGQRSVVLMCEGRTDTTAPLVLEAYYNGSLIAANPLNLSISSVKDMFRYLNVRTNDLYFTRDPDRPATVGLWETRLDAPPNLPDSYLLETGETQKTIIMVHGLDWDENETPAGHSELFKRLYQAGSNARYVGVSWASDLSRTFGQPLVYANDVIGAFVAAKLVKDAIPSSLLGSNTTVVAHSLGNVLVSSAIQDQGMNTGNYVMLNPAVPTEAYDGRAPASDADRRNMTHPDWRGAAADGSDDYPERVMSAGWSTLFSSADPRSKITWDNRFGDVLDATTTWQFYSSGEEVLRSADGNMPVALDMAWFVPFWDSQSSVAGSQEWTWVYHELTKGVLYLPYALVIPRHRSAGWAFNSDWDNQVEVGTDEYGAPVYEWVRKTPAETTLIADTNLVASPFFKEFNPDEHISVTNWWNPAVWIYLPDGNFEILNRLPSSVPDYTLNKLKNHAKLLAEMIPPLSSPAGGKALGTKVPLGRKTDMNALAFKNGAFWPVTRPGKSGDQQEKRRWLHGDYKDAPLLLTHTLYKKIKEISERD